MKQVNNNTTSMRKLKYRSPSRFMINAHREGSKEYSWLCSLSNAGILYRGNTGRVCKRTNPAVFRTREACYLAIKKTKEYAKKKDLPWTDIVFTVFPVSIKKLNP